jgi:hypothetical protein
MAYLKKCIFFSQFWWLGKARSKHQQIVVTAEVPLPYG